MLKGPKVKAGSAGAATTLSSLQALGFVASAISIRVMFNAVQRRFAHKNRWQQSVRQRSKGTLLRRDSGLVLRGASDTNTLGTDPARAK